MSWVLLTFIHWEINEFISSPGNCVAHQTGWLRSLILWKLEPSWTIPNSEYSFSDSWWMQVFHQNSSGHRRLFRYLNRSYFSMLITLLPCKVPWCPWFYLKDTVPNCYCPVTCNNFYLCPHIWRAYYFWLLQSIYEWDISFSVHWLEIHLPLP